LLQAGRRILDDAPVGGFAGHVRSAEVTKAANMSAGSLYYHWMSQDEYLVDLVDYVLSDINRKRSDRAERQAHENFTSMLDQGKPLVDAVRSAGNQVFDELQRDSSCFLQMALWAAQAEDRSIPEQLREMYQNAEDPWIEAIERTLERQGREWRPPFTSQLFTTLLTALVEGLRLRSEVDKKAVADLPHGNDPAWSVFATATISLYLSATVEVDPDRTEPVPDIRDLAAQLPLR